MSYKRDCVKSVHIRSFSCSYFFAFRLITKVYSVDLRIKFECAKIRSRKTPKYGYVLHSESYAMENFIR